MRRHLVSFTPCFILLLTMLVLAGCAGKIVLPPFKPSVESPPVTPRPGVRLQVPPKQTTHGQAKPEKAFPEQPRPEQTIPEASPSATTGGETSGQPAELWPPLQPKLGPAASLYHQGERHIKEGTLDKAEMSMERALRIEPRNPYYWHAMAEIRLRQGKKEEAIQCCLKSNSLAFGNSQLIRWNKTLISRAQASGTTDADLPRIRQSQNQEQSKL